MKASIGHYALAPAEPSKIPNELVIMGLPSAAVFNADKPGISTGEQQLHQLRLRPRAARGEILSTVLRFLRGA